MYLSPFVRMKVMCGLLLIVIFFNLTLSEQADSCSSEDRCQCKNYVSGLFADCSRLGLSNSPKFNSSVVSVNLSYNFITDFPDISYIPRTLEHLDLSGNLIKNISTERSKGHFATFEHLHTLNVSSNFIPLDSTVYKKDLFVNLTKLTVLDISNNTITGEIFPNLDEVFKPLSALKRLSIDGAENYTFGEGFNELRNLTFLKLQGLCNNHRLREIPEQYFQHLPRLEVLDISATLHWDFTNFTTYHNRCSLYYIHEGAIAKLPKLKYLDMSNNRGLGLCGFRNISLDLPFTEIKTLKASFLNCEHGDSERLFCNDIKPLSNTSLERLYFDGNNIAFGQTGLLYYLPLSLKTLSIRSNRFVLSRYAYCNLWGLRNLTDVDISYMNEYEVSHIDTAFPNCGTFWRNINCEQLRNDGPKRTLIPDFMESCIFICSDFKKKMHYTYEKGELSANRSTSNRNYAYPLNFIVKQDSGVADVIIVPPNIQHITLIGSRLGYTLPWISFSSPTLLSLIISNNQFYSIMGPICNATNLRYLDISNNKCSQLSTYIFTELYALEYLILDNNLIGYSDVLNDNLSDTLLATQTQLKTLSLTSNMISNLPENLFLNVSRLQLLNLSRNLFTDWNVKIQNLQNFELLNLSENQIPYLSEKAMNIIDEHAKVSKLTIDLSHNPFRCNCESLKFLKWLIERQRWFRHFYKYTCDYNHNKTYLSSAKLLDKLDKDCYSYIRVIIVACVLLVAFILFLVMLLIYIYRKRWKLRYWYYIAKREYFRGYERLEDDNRYHFDAFISYADEDRLFVKQEMIEVLENREGCKLCIHHRDFIPGSDIADNIINAIHQSRKVIFVITEAFLNSSWCLYELHMGHTEYVVSRRGQNMLILIFKENVRRNLIPNKILHIIKEEVYLEYPEENENLPTFWSQLSDSMTY